jgi:predicted DNA-binding transcriptional regulator AlpA
MRRFYSVAAVCEATTWSRTTLWRQWRSGKFPAPVQMSPGRVAFDAEAVDQALLALVARKPAA